MKYKVGQKVKIRTWEDIEYNYGCSYPSSILQAPMQQGCRYTYHFDKKREEEINEKFPDRILIIKNVFEGYERNYYHMVGIGRAWQDYMIECLAKNYKKPEPIYSRFEILDL